ncbi:MAG: 50S ribosomal protein L4 [Candidatus Gracilibacteria bacterium]|nr:50S ribosomal protein L4 [Candidatus Gracilibacteria bacterium]
MEAILYNSTGVETGKIKLNESIFGLEVNSGLIHRLLMLQRSNSRSPIAHTKSRGDRTGSTRKIYKQKGTGNARAGSARSPIRKGGGVAFGPKSNRNFTISMNKKERRIALFSLLSSKAMNNQIKVIDLVNNQEYKTKNVVEIIKNINTTKGLFAMLPNDRELFLATRNIETVKPIGVGYLNPVDLLKYNDLIFTKDSLNHLDQIYS